MVLWKCTSCNMVIEATEPPNECPKCGAPRERLVELSGDQEKLVLKSRRTNYLHIEAVSLLRKLLEVAEEGIRENLDPGCVKIFEEERTFAKTMIQKILAEIEGHVKKGKWG